MWLSFFYTIGSFSFFVGSFFSMVFLMEMNFIITYENPCSNFGFNIEVI